MLAIDIAVAVALAVGAGTGGGGGLDACERSDRAGKADSAANGKIRFEPTRDMRSYR